MISLEFIKYWEGFSVSEKVDSNLQVEIDTMHQLTMSWFGFYDNVQKSKDVNQSEQRWLGMELSLITIEVLTKYVVLCRDRLEVQDEIDAEIKSSLTIVCDQMNCFLVDNIRKEVQRLKANVNDPDQPCVGSLAAYLFWVERMLEAVLMKFEAVAIIDPTRLEPSDIQSHRSLIHPQLSSLDWIQEKGIMIIASHVSYGAELVIDPLLLEDQSKALNDMKTFVQQWDGFKTQILQEELVKSIEVLKDTKVDPGFALFV
jgi:hypothetical protein